MALAQFDYESILNDLTSKLQEKLGGSVSGGSSVRRILEVIAEKLAQVVRYSEYLTRETKWSLAQNSSSILTQLELFGYDPHRKVGARGTLRVSASPAFNTTYPYNITIPKFSRFSNGSLTFCTTEDVVLGNTSTFVDIPIVQGNPKSVTFLGPEINNSVYMIMNDSIEDTVYDMTLNSVPMVEVDSFGETQISLNGSETETSQVGGPYEYRVRNIQGFEGIELQFSSGAEYTEAYSFVFRYLITEGVGGDVSSLNSITTPLDTFMDARGVNVQLYCTNVSLISGGADYETIDEMRENAPLAFNRTDRYITKNDYTAALNRLLSGNSVFYIWTEQEANDQISQFMDSYDFYNNSKIYICGGYYSETEGTFTPWNEGILKSINDDPELSNYKAFTDYFVLQDPAPTFFYLVGTVYFNGKLTDATQARAEVDSLLQTEYALKNRTFFDSIYHSDYISIFKDLGEIDHVDVKIILYVELSFSAMEGGGYETVDMMTFGFSEANENRYILTVADSEGFFKEDLAYAKQTTGSEYDWYEMDDSPLSDISWVQDNITPAVGRFGSFRISGNTASKIQEGDRLMVRFIPFNDDAVLMNQNQILLLTGREKYACIWKDGLHSEDPEYSLVLEEIRV